ncbi:SPOR domain-containing protein [Marinomonas dokdonensis]|uniref:SPOR domain-containing protein n=1 Tax=Marinomonas dokdonensis TaxID=328224 RepID=UPI00405565C6
MNLFKGCMVVLVGASLVACSSDGQNTFMAYQDLQDMVKDHDEKWQQVQPQLERLEALELEVAELKEKNAALTNSASPEMDADTTPVSSTGVSFSQPIESTSLAAPTSVTEVAPVTSSEPVTAPVVQAPEMAKAAPVVSAPVVATSSSNFYGVQLASYSTKEEATRGWRILSKESPENYVDLAPRVNTKSINGRTMNQLKVGPFESKPFATDFCNMLKQQQKDCLVTRYDGEPISSY